MLTLLLSAAAAAATPFPVGKPLPRMALLTPGTSRYLRYTVKDGERTPLDIWTRTVSYEPMGGVRRLHITQRWERAGTPRAVSTQDSWFDATTFRPLTHGLVRTRDGKTETKAWRFDKDAVVGTDPANASFRQATPEAPFNFEYDLETLQVLPWKKGMVADLVFYDPGLQAPAHYQFREAGEVSLPGPDGKPIPCWLVTADFNTGKVAGRFWIAKTTQRVLHEEGEFDGTLYVKTLIANDSAAR